MRVLGWSGRALAVAALLASCLTAPVASSTRAASPVIPADITGIDVILPIGRTISGTISDGSDQPIVGIEVAACTADDGTCRSATTGADGTYAIEGLPPDAYLVRVYALDTLDFLDSWYTPGGAVADSSGATPVDVTTANATSIDLTPLVGYSISGTVTGAGAGPLVGVQVYALGSAGAGSTVSNASGHFTIHHLANGNYMVGEYMADGLNFVSGQIQAGTVIEDGPGTLFVISGASLTGQDFSVAAGFRISGTLTGPGASSAVAIPTAGPLDLCNCAEVPVGPDGSWQFVGLWPGTYGVEFAPASASPFDNQFVLGAWDGTSVLNPDQNSEAPIVVTTSDVTGIDASIPVGPTFHGTVTGQDGPLAVPAFVTIHGKNTGDSATTLTDGSGAFSFQHVPADSYDIQVSQKTHIGGYYGPGGFAVDEALATSVAVPTAGGKGVTIVLPLGLAISGTVTNQSAQPLAGIGVSRSGGVSPAGEAFTTTAADGSWQLTSGSVGDYQIHFGPEVEPSPYLSGEYNTSHSGNFNPDPGSGTLVHIGSQGTGSSYVPITPLRVVDSRTPTGVAGILHSGVPQTFAVATLSGTVPLGATAVTGNVTVVGQNAAGYVSITPTPTATPSSSTINVPLGDVRANNFTTPLAGDGSLAVVYEATTGKTANVVVDITGYFVAGTGHATYTPMAPVRVLNSRPVGNVGLSGKFLANIPRTLTVAGTHGIPGAAVAITGNVTVVGQTNPGYLAVTPTPTTKPDSSTLNFPVGDVRANGLTVALSGGKVAIVYKAAAGSTDVVLDVTGYYTNSPSGLLFYPLLPGRLIDTRSGVLATALSGSFSAGTARTFAVAGRAGIPLGAAALTGNLTVVGQTAAGFAAITKTPTSKPSTSTLNFPNSDIRANGITAPIGLDGKASLVYVAASGAKTQLLLDITGYFQ